MRCMFSLQFDIQKMLPKYFYTAAIFFHISIIHAQLPDGFFRERIVAGLNPTSMVCAPDGRIFITEKNGVVRIIREDTLVTEPLVSIEVDDSNERGLGHMVLHPDFDL